MAARQETYTRTEVRVLFNSTLEDLQKVYKAREESADSQCRHFAVEALDDESKREKALAYKAEALNWKLARELLSYSFTRHCPEA